jgi:hypothetical protein
MTAWSIGCHRQEQDNHVFCDQFVRSGDFLCVSKEVFFILIKRRQWGTMRNTGWRENHQRVSGQTVRIDKNSRQSVST